MTVDDLEPKRNPVHYYSLFKDLMSLSVLGITCAGAVGAAESPSQRVSDDEVASLRRTGDTFMHDFSREEYARATKELAKTLGVKGEETENEAAEFERKLLGGNRVSLGGDPMEGCFILVGSRVTGHRQVKLVYLDQRSLGSCPVVIEFSRPGESWIARFEVGNVGTREDLEPFWIANEPPQLTGVIPEFPELLEST